MFSNKSYIIKLFNSLEQLKRGIFKFNLTRGRPSCHGMVVLHLFIQSMLITTQVVSSVHTHGESYSIHCTTICDQFCMLKVEQGQRKAWRISLPKYSIR